MQFPSHIQDFSEIHVQKGKYHLRTPFPYYDTCVLMINASDAQSHEAVEYVGNAAVVLLNSSCKGLKPTKLSSAAVSCYDPQILEQFRQAAADVVALLYKWWGYFTDDDESEDTEAQFAQQIIRQARSSLMESGCRYIQTEFNPMELRNAVRYQVLLRFLDILEHEQLITVEELAQYRQGAASVFAPTPSAPASIRQPSDRDVFLEVMRELIRKNSKSIINENDEFVKSQKPFAAWREISSVRHLVIPEDTWAKNYQKAVTAKKREIDTSSLKVDRWSAELQKQLCNQELIKKPSSGYRYRYKLYKDESQVHVVAIPATLLEN